MANPKDRGHFLYSFWVKAGIFLLSALLVPVMLVYGGCMLMAYSQGWYSAEAPDFYRSSFCQDALWEEMPYALQDTGWLLQSAEVRENYIAALSQYYPADDSSTNLRFILRDNSGAVLYDNTASNDPFCAEWGENVTLYARSGLPAQDDIFWASCIYNAALRHYTAAPWMLGICLLLELVFLVALSRAAGRSAETGEIMPGWQERIPIDIYFGVEFGLGLLLILLFFTVMDEFSRLYNPLALLFCGLFALVGTALLLSGWMSLCARVKLGKWWKNSLTFALLRLFWRFCLWCWKGVCSLFRLFFTLLRGIPLFWKTAVCCGVYSLVLTYYAQRRHWNRFAFFLLLGCIFLCWVSLQLRRLQKGGQALARGDLEAQMDTRYLLFDFRRHGEDLNAIGQGMRIAVEEQTRSERLKAELITNVSHDIKTPLTSIVNYVDLLQKPHTPEQQTDYLEVLARQSRRLKKLTEDLVEMSKASAGSLPCHPARRSVRELAEQVMGEYEERLEKAGLTPVLNLPQEDVFCMADGALLWRVLDNLLSNACKYAQTGTRLYFSVTTPSADTVAFTLRNISRDALNISAEELMERFVRGDSSRSTEGSGLGLNIAKSLMELQGGKLCISVDGDLFKAQALLPRAAAPAEGGEEVLV